MKIASVVLGRALGVGKLVFPGSGDFGRFGIANGVFQPVQLLHDTLPALIVAVV